MKILVLIILSTNAFGEYRAYQYAVKNTSTPNPTKIVTSSLNPRAYLAYNGMEGMNVDLLRTWICPGFTGHKKAICSSPYRDLLNKEI